MEYRMNRSLSASYRLAGVVFLAAAVLLWVCSGLELTGDDSLQLLCRIGAVVVAVLGGVSILRPTRARVRLEDDDTLVCYSYSKTLSIPGERMGYLAVCKRIRDFADVMDACSGAARALGHICASNLYQRVIERCVDVVADVDYYRQNRDLLVGGLEAMGFTCVHPDGAFYLFMKCPIADSMAFCEKAKEYEIMVVPGHDFGVPGYLRVSYCVARETIEKSMPAFRKLAEFYGLK